MVEENADLKRAFEALKNKTLVYDVLFNYYDGDQPLVYTSKRLDEMFKGLSVTFAQNWCAVVIDSAKDRINLASIQAGKENEIFIQEFVERNELLIEADEIHEAAMVTGEAFYIVWDGGDKKADGYFNDPRLCHVFYDAEQPRKKSFAAKWWVGEDKKRYLTLYYPDRLEYYVSTKESKDVTNEKGFQRTKERQADNEYKEIPVFHFRLGRRRVKSDLKNIIAPQDGVNKLLTDMMVTSEFAAFPQRWIITDADVKGKLKNAPNEIWKVPAGDGISQPTAVGSFPAADLENYLKGIDSLAASIGVISRTPKHYFFSQGGDPSGEALIALEAPLNKKAQKRIDMFIPTWQEVIAFAAKVEGKDLSKQEVTVNYDRPETVQPKTQAEIRYTNTQAGVPLEVSLREEGKSDEEIGEVLKAKDEADVRSKTNLSAALLNARRNFDQNNTEGI